MKKIKAIIIDDEVSNRRLIKNLIATLNPDYEILGEAERINDAYELIQQVKPDVLFLDIKMPGGNGFQLLEKFDEVPFEVVFISGFDEYAIKAFEYNALDYILKPIDTVRFMKTLSKVQQTIETKNVSPNRIKEVLQTYDLKQLFISKLSVHQGNQVVVLNIAEIMYIQSDNKCSVFKVANNEKYTSSKQLSDFEFILNNHIYFIKVNKGTFINANYVTRYSKGITCLITMKDEKVIEVPRRKKSEILELLAGRKIAENE